MKYFNSLKNLAVASILGVSGLANGQTGVSHPLSFGTYPAPALNYYANYVGIRFLVTAPSSIAGSKVFTTPNDSTGTAGSWAGPDFTMVNKQVIIGPMADSNGCAAYPTGYFNGKIALIWRGTCEFGFKALQAQNAGAIAVVIVNNVGGGPVGMGAGASGGSVTIPMYMIGLDDGTALLNQLNAGDTPTMTIETHWGLGSANDLGFVPTGYAITANNAMPYSQINTTSTAGMNAYANKDGAFVANYGTHTATNVTLKDSLFWTPAESTSSTLVHSGSIVKTAPFPETDSIYAMFMPKYNLPNTPSAGMYTLKYTISSDSADAFLGDNNISYNFYATDSLYCKSRYDFTNNRPFSNLYTGPGTAEAIMWSVPYFIANAGGYFDSVQFSVISTNTSGIIHIFPNGDNVTVYLFNWTDSNSDGLMQNKELNLVGLAYKNFDGITDSSWETFKVAFTGDTTFTATNVIPIPVQGNSTYVLSASVLANYYLGCDGVLSGYPRSYGRAHFDTYNEYYNPIWFGDRSTSFSGSTPTNMNANPDANYYPWAFDGSYSGVSDSVNFNLEKGLIPSLAFTTRTQSGSGVAQPNSATGKLELYPNPATDYFNASISLPSPASTVIYRVIDVQGKTISTDIHNNVQNEVYYYNTSKLATGSYYLIVVADGKPSFKKFTVIR